MATPPLPPGLQQLLSHYYPLSPQATAYLHQHLQHRLLPAKTLLQRPSQVARHIYFIESGLLRSYQHIDEREQTTWFMQQGQVAIDIESFFSQQPSAAAVEALEACSLYYLSHQQYQELCALCHHFCNTARRHTEQYYCLAETRNRLLRMTSPALRLQLLETIFPDLSLRCPLKHIASYLGITQATLSRLRSRRKF